MSIAVEEIEETYIRYDVDITYRNGECVRIEDVLQLPHLSNGVLEINTASGQWKRIPINNVREWDNYPKQVKLT